MRALLCCIGVLAVLLVHPDAARAFNERRRRDGELCVSCSGKDCETREGSSTCAAAIAPAADPEKSFVEALTKAVGADFVPAKFTNCYAVKFKDKNGTEGEVRDCGPADICKTAKGKEADLGVTIDGCEDCAKAAAACNNMTLGAGGGGTPAPGDEGGASSEKDEGGAPEATTGMMETTTSEDEGEGGGDSSAQTYRLRGAAGCWVWAVATALVLRLV